MAARKKKKIKAPAVAGESGVRVDKDARGSFSAWVEKSKANVQNAFAREAFSQGLTEQPSVTVVKNKPGRNPHVGINIPKTTNAELSASRQARNKKRRAASRVAGRRK